MKYLRHFFAASTLSVCSFSTLAADYSNGDRHKNDNHWMDFNLIYALKELPRAKDAGTGHDALEIEFGGRSGILDLYGYVDVYNLANSDSSDKKGLSKTYIRLHPRFSLDSLFTTDLSIGPFQEFYLSTLFKWGGGGATNCAVMNGKEVCIPSVDMNNSFWGLGTDVMVPWLGKLELNLYRVYDLNEKVWNGYQVSARWLKPFYQFTNDSFVFYEGYLDYQFGGKDNFLGMPKATSGGNMFNGFYWQYQHWIAGYGFRLFKDVYLIKDSAAVESTGISHYFSISYKL